MLVMDEKNAGFVLDDEEAKPVDPAKLKAEGTATFAAATKYAADYIGMPEAETPQETARFVEEEVQAQNQSAMDDLGIRAAQEGDYETVTFAASQEARPISVTNIASSAALEADRDSTQDNRQSLTEHEQSLLGRSLVLDKYTQQIDAEIEDRGFLSRVGGVVATVTPAGEWLQLQTLLGEDFDIDFTGDVLLEVRRRFSYMTVDEAEGFIQKLYENYENSAIVNPTDFKLVLDTLREGGYGEGDAVWDNLWNWVDVADVTGAAALAKAGKTSKLLARYLEATGDAATTNTKTLIKTPSDLAYRAGNSREGARRVQTQSDLTGHATSPVTSPDQTKGKTKNPKTVKQEQDVGAANAVLKSEPESPVVNPTEIYSKLQKAYDDTVMDKVKFLDEVEQSGIVKRTAQDLADRIEQVRIRDKVGLKPPMSQVHIKTSYIAEEDTHIVTSRLGTGVGGQQGFISEEVAEQAIKDYGLDPTISKVVKDEGTHYIEVTPIEKLRTEDLESWVRGERPRGIGIGKTFRAGGGLQSWDGYLNHVIGADQLLSEKAGGRAALTDDARRNVDRLEDAAKKALNLKKPEKQRVQAVLNKSKKNVEWMDEDTLRNVERLSDKEIEAYQTVRAVSDLSWSVRNESVWMDRVRAGYGTVRIEKTNSSEFISIDARKATLPENQRSFEALDPITGETRSVSRDDPNWDGLSFYRTLEDDTLIVIPKSNHNLRTLSSSQIPYVAGGTRKYQGRFFMKQSKIDNEAKTIGRSRTLSAFQTGAMGEKAVKATNDILRIYATEPDPRLATEQIQRIAGGRYPGISTWEAVDGLVRNGTLDATVDEAGNLVNPIELVATGGETASAQAARKRFGDDIVSDAEVDRGEHRELFDTHLSDILGDGEIPIADMSDEMATNFANIERLGPIEVYRDRISQDWLREYDSILKEPKTVGAFSDPKFNGYVDNPSPAQQKLINRAEGERIAVRNQLSAVSTPDMLEGRLMRSIGEAFSGVLGSKLAEKAVGKYGSKLGEKVGDKISDFTPGNFFKKVATHAYLGGFFNPRQWMIQGSQYAFVYSLAGTKTPKIASGAWLMRNGAIRARSPAIQAEAVKYAKLMGWKEDEYLAVQEGLRNMMKDSVGGSAWTDGANRNTRLEDWSLKMFSMTEAGNRSQSYILSHLEFIKKHGKLRPETLDEKAEISRKAELYSGNMTNFSRASWQRGWSSVATQFWSYNAKMIGLMLGRDLTLGQKTKVLTGLTAAYGTAGLTGWDLLNQETPLGEEEGELTADKILSQGILSTLVSFVAGKQVDVGEEMGPNLFSFWSDKISNRYETKLHEYFFGPGISLTVDLVYDTAEVFEKVLKMADAWMSGDQITPDNALSQLDRTVRNNIPPYSRAMAAHRIWRTGQYMSRSNVLVADNLTALDGVAMLFGIKPHEVNQYYAGMSEKEERIEVNKAINTEVRAIMWNFKNGDITLDEVHARLADVRSSLTPAELYDANRIIKNIISETLKGVSKVEGDIRSNLNRNIRIMGGKPPRSKRDTRTTAEKLKAMEVQ